MGIGLLGNALFPQRAARQSAVADAFNRTQQVRQPITVHRAVVGRARVSGPVIFLHTNAAQRTAYASQVNGGVAATYEAESLLYLCHAIAGHRIDAVEVVQIDGVPISAAQFSGRAHAQAGLGTADQVASPLLLAETDGKWTAAHRLRGRAFLASVLKYDEAVFRSGVPNLSAIIRGAPEIYDPRTGATAWTNNAALVVAWYLTWSRGMRADWDEIDEPTLIASANICDEIVPLKAGGTERRYTCSGTFDLDEAPGTVLERLLSSMAGTAVNVGGRWYIHAGAWVPPTATITADMLRGAVSVRANRAARDLWNGVRAVYVRPESGWQPTDAPPLLDADALALDGGAESYTDLALDFTVSGTRAQRLMQIALRKNRLQRQVQLPLNFSGLPIRCMDVVTLDLPRIGVGTYRVSRWALAPEGGVDLVLEQDAASVYAWNPETDERPLGAVASVDFPSGASLTAPAITVATPTAPVPATIDVSWTTIAGAASYPFQWRAPGSNVWTDVVPGGTSVAVATAGVAAFRVQARAAEAYSLWADAELSAPPTTFRVVGNGSGYDVTVVRAAGTTRVQLFAGETNVFADAVKLTAEPTGGTTSITDTSTIGKWVWARGVNAVGNVGAATSPIFVNPSQGGSDIGQGDGTGDGGGGGGDGGSGE